MSIQIKGQGGLNNPLVARLKIGPDEGQLQGWINSLYSAAETFETAGATLRNSSVDPEAWYGAAADALRARAIEMGLATTGMGELLILLAEYLNLYLTAAQTWDGEYAAAQSLDQAGIANDALVGPAYAKAWTDYTGTLTSAHYVTPADVWPRMDPTLVGNAPAPDDIIEFNSPQKLQALADVASALDKLSGAGGLAAGAVETLLRSMGSAGSLSGLVELGAGASRPGADDLRQGGGYATNYKPDDEPDETGEQLRELNDYVTSAHDSAGVADLLKDPLADGAGKLGGLTEYTAGVLGAGADLLTLHDNPDSGLHGDVTAGAAGVNLAATSLGTADAIGAISLEAVPGVDVGVTILIVGTGLYSLGNSLSKLGTVTQTELP